MSKEARDECRNVAMPCEEWTIPRWCALLPHPRTRLGREGLVACDSFMLQRCLNNAGSCEPVRGLVPPPLGGGFRSVRFDFKIAKPMRDPEELWAPGAAN